MKSSIELDISKSGPLFEGQNNEIIERAKYFNKLLQSQKMTENRWVGWLTYPKEYVNSNEFQKLIEKANLLKASDIEVLVVIAIGGSYTGSRAVLEALKGHYKNKKTPNSLEIMFGGKSLSAKEFNEQVEYLKDKKFAINVISKSGTTLENAINFLEFEKLLIQRVGTQRAKELIFVTTDPLEGPLRAYALERGYTAFEIPQNIGGRFSVFTPVGTFPLAVAGLNVFEFLQGASKAFLEFFASSEIDKNSALQYAILRNLLYQKFPLEMLITYEPSLALINEWWRQLFAESEGKDNKGLLPISSVFSTDLHSVGQFIQDGPKLFFQTTIWIEELSKNWTLSKPEGAFARKYQFLANKDLHFINKCVFEASVVSHNQIAQIPQIIIKISKLNESSIGQLFAFFMISCTISASLLGVNPFDQPGVENYKKEALKLLEN